MHALFIAIIHQHSYQKKYLIVKVKDWGNNKQPWKGKKRNGVEVWRWFWASVSITKDIKGTNKAIIILNFWY